MTKLKPKTKLQDNPHTKGDKLAANKVLKTLTMLLEIDMDVATSIAPVELSVSARIKRLKVTL